MPTRYQGFSGPPPGLVARSARQRALQMNGHPAGATLRTEPGLQANWQINSEHRTSKFFTCESKDATINKATQTLDMNQI